MTREYVATVRPAAEEIGARLRGRGRDGPAHSPGKVGQSAVHRSGAATREAETHRQRICFSTERKRMVAGDGSGSYHARWLTKNAVLDLQKEAAQVSSTSGDGEQGRSVAAAAYRRRRARAAGERCWTLRKCSYMRAGRGKTWARAWSATGAGAAAGSQRLGRALSGRQGR
jgi:hypothetical protein